MEAETVHVERRGATDLASFACHDITRSTLINRVCYDAADHSMIIQVNALYFQYCNIPPATLDTFLNASSMGQYYRSTIAGANGSYGCLTHRVSKP